MLDTDASVVAISGILHILLQEQEGNERTVLWPIAYNKVRSDTTSNSDASEIAIHSLLVEWKQRRYQFGTHRARCDTFEKDMVC